MGALGPGPPQTHSDLGGPTLHFIVSACQWTPGCLRAEWQGGIIPVWKVAWNQPRRGTADDGDLVDLL